MHFNLWNYLNTIKCCDSLILHKKRITNSINGLRFEVENVKIAYIYKIKKKPAFFYNMVEKSV